jgi:hypothetical protein
MTGQVPSMVVDLGILLTFFGLLVATSKLPPVKWLWIQLVAEPITRWLDSRNEAALHPVLERLDRIDHLTAYHLGPNGSTPPVHLRLQSLEARLTEDE